MSRTSLWDDGSQPDWPFLGLNGSMIDFTSHLGLQTSHPASTGTLGTLGEASLSESNAMRPFASTSSTDDDDEDQDLVNQMSTRIGSLRMAPDGRLRYFGAQTNDYLLSNNMAPYLAIAPRSIQNERDQLLRNAGVDQEVAPDFVNHLIALYFRYFNACHPVVHDTVYEAGRARWERHEDNHGYYSETLTNAMCAIGASFEGRYHPRLATFPRSLAEFFADRAKALLELDLDSPGVSTVQALLLMSSHELSLQRGARSWLYGGMAMRLCFDLGLHVNTDTYVASRIMSQEESHARCTAFWSSYVLNYFSSFKLGRPFCVDKSEITIARPIVATAGLIDPTETTTSPDHGGITAMVMEQRLILCDIVELVLRAVYGYTHVTPQDLQQWSQSATTSMLEWKTCLPTSLTVRPDVSHPLALLALHLEYHYLLILLHRPWTSRYAQPKPPQGQSYHHARTVCIESAKEIARLLLLFERDHGLRRVTVETSQMLPSAALVLIYSSLSGSSEEAKDEILQHLTTIMRGLDELSSVLDSARQSRDYLLAIQQNWQNRYRKSKKRSQEVLD
ncbi:Fungal specific transcription factor domain-containing protein 66 [Elsinoe fawcettii]|nr:Fungal specific transcription factor domain-containing protein 66 [Elsinoe fawcettii]